MPKIKELCSGVASAKLRRASSNAAVVAAVVIAVGACGGNPQDAQGTRTPVRQSSSAATNLWKDFVQASSTSGCPSEACSDVLAQVRAGATTRTVPSDLTPNLNDAAIDMKPPEGGNCSVLPVSGLDSSFQPCLFDAGASPTAPVMILIGNSRALMWSRAVLALASQLGYRFGLVQHEACSMPRVEDPAIGRTGLSAADCKEWEDAAINWVNQQNPGVVLVASGPDLNDKVSPADLVAGWAATLKELQGPGRKVFVFGEMPRMDQDPPRCLAANGASALKCVTPASAAIQADEQQAGLDAARQSGASYVNLTPWLCTTDVCPAIVGHYLAYRDQNHLTSTYTQALVPVLQKAVDIGHA
jgi:hypothetical protein